MTTSLINSVKYILEKIILTWQFIVLLLLFLMAPTLRGLLENAETIKAQGFEFTFHRTAVNFGLMDSDINKVKELSYDEMEVFLIKGGEHGDQTYYKLNWLSDERFYVIHRHMDSLGLIKVNWDETNRTADGHWHVVSNSTEEGKKLYRAIMSGIISSFQERRSK